MDRRKFLKQTAMFGIGSSAALSAYAGASRNLMPQSKPNRNGALFDSKPNILMITCHDLGKHLGCYGINSVNSPNIDRLAEKGCKFTNFFATAPTCSPSRAAMHTGRYPQSNGVMGLTHEPWWWSYNAGEKHTASILRKLGYQTHLIGFQHVTDDKPDDLGYDFVSPRAKHKDAQTTVEMTVDLLKKANETDQPFFAKVGFFEVHRPFVRGKDTSKGVHVPHFLQDTPEIREDLAEFQGTIKYFDQRFGEIIESLEQSNVSENTLVIFTSDHGIPYIGAKWTLFDPGIEIPLIMYYPKAGLTGGQTYSQLLSNVDVLPTLLDLLGEKIPTEMQGKSFRKLIENKTEASPRSEIFAQHNKHALRDNSSRCIRTEKYKLIRYFEAGRNIVFPTNANPQKVAQHIERPKRKGTRPFVVLYDLKADPHERNNLADKPEFAKVVKELSVKLWDWMVEVNDPFIKGPLPTPYYQKSIEDFKNLVGN